MGMYDYFVGTLLCPVCGAVSPANCTTNMQTKIRNQPKLEDLRVGDEVPTHDIAGCYRQLKVPKQGEPIRLMALWECPSCDAGRNWAEVVIVIGIITSIEAVPFDRAHVERSHFISDDAIDEVQLRTGIPYAELHKCDFRELLYRIL